MNMAIDECAIDALGACEARLKFTTARANLPKQRNDTKLNANRINDGYQADINLIF